MVAEATPRRPAAAGSAQTPLQTRNADDPFAWYTEASSPAIVEAIRDIAGKVARYASVPRRSPGADVFGRLYQHLFPQGLRHGLGEYYTPEWLAEHVLDATGYSASGDGRLLDPACGSGVFLLAAIRRIRRARGAIDRAARTCPRNPRQRRRFRSESAGGDDRPGELPSGHRRSVGPGAGGRDSGLSAGRDSRRRRAGRAVRLRGRQSAVDRVGQSAGGVPRGDRAAVAALRAVLAFRHGSPARRRQERPLDAGPLRRGRPLPQARRAAGLRHHPNAAANRRGPATVFGGFDWARPASRSACSASTTWSGFSPSPGRRIGPP